MPDDNKVAMQKVYDMINSGDLSQLGELMAADCIEHQEFPGLSGTAVEQFQQFVGLFRGAFPDFHCSVEDMLAEGDLVVVRCRMSGTHKGDFMGIPATGKAFSIEAMDQARFRDGKAIEHWGVADTAGMMMQLGLTPPSA